MIRVIDDRLTLPARRFKIFKMKDIKLKKWAIISAVAVPVLGGLLIMLVRYNSAKRTPEMQFIEQLYRSSLDLRAKNQMNEMKVSAEGKELQGEEAISQEAPVSDEAKKATTESRGLTVMNAQELRPFFSTEFVKLWDENKGLCANIAVGEDCGWEGDGDLLLDAQEFDPELTYDSAMVRVFKFSEGFYEATFNIFPKDLQGGKFKPQHDRRVRFWIKQEGEKYVIDNIAYVYPNTIEDAREQMKIDREVYSKIDPNH